MVILACLLQTYIIYHHEMKTHENTPHSVAFSLPQVDKVNGTFQYDTDNDAPTYQSWYDSTTLIDPYQDVLFYVVIEDIDNTSSELTVTLYYSNDSFGTYNISKSMSYASSPSTDNYRFTYLFPGEPLGTYYQYYYQVFDGDNYVEQPAAYASGILFDIQWDNPPSGDTGGGGEPMVSEPLEITTTTVAPPADIDDVNIIISGSTLLLGFVLILGVKLYMNYRENNY